MNQNETAESIVRYLGYPHQVLNILPEDITEFYRQTYLRGQREGFVPVLVNADAVLEDCLDTDDDEVYCPQDTLHHLTDGKQLLDSRLDDLPDEGDSSEFDDIMGDMADIGQNEFRALYSHEGLIVLFELPAANPWEIPAYVPFSGFNDCPAPEEMTSVCKYWYEQYGAVPAAITHDTLEFLLPEPVPEEKAVELAKEHYAFCPDIGDMGIPLSLMSRTLKHSQVWQFWWD